MPSRFSTLQHVIRCFHVGQHLWVDGMLPTHPHTLLHIQPSLNANTEMILLWCLVGGAYIGNCVSKTSRQSSTLRRVLCSGKPHSVCTVCVCHNPWYNDDLPATISDMQWKRWKTLMSALVTQKPKAMLKIFHVDQDRLINLPPGYATMRAPIPARIRVLPLSRET